MQMVAASKMKRAQAATIAGHPYTLLLGEILANLPLEEETIEHPLLDEREIHQRGVLLVSTDKGLCGGLNANLFREIGNFEREHQLNSSNTAYIAIGRKASQFLARTKRNLIADFTVSDEVTFKEVRAVANFMLQSYEKQEIDTIDVLYPRYVNTLNQEPTHVNLAPIKNFREQIQALRESYGRSEEEPDNRDSRQMSFEPSPREILEQLPPLFIRHQIYQRILEMKASEQSARMVAMKSATDNANNLVDDLNLEYNKARQAGITQEILELAAATASTE